MFACETGHLEVAKWLADVKGASVTDLSNVGSQLYITVLSFALVLHHQYWKILVGVLPISAVISYL